MRIDVRLLFGVLTVKVDTDPLDKDDDRPGTDSADLTVGFTERVSRVTMPT